MTTRCCASSTRSTSRAIPTAPLQGAAIELAFDSKIVEGNPDDADWRRLMIEAQDRLGALLLAANKGDEALSAFQAAAEKARALAPDRAGRELNLRTLAQLAGAQALKGDSAAAVTTYVEAVGIARKMIADDSKDAFARGELAMLLVSASDMQKRLGRLQDAEDRPQRLARGLQGAGQGHQRRRQMAGRAGDGLRPPGRRIGRRRRCGGRDRRLPPVASGLRGAAGGEKKRPRPPRRRGHDARGAGAPARRQKGLRRSARRRAGVPRACVARRRPRTPPTR